MKAIFCLQATAQQVEPSTTEVTQSTQTNHSPDLAAATTAATTTASTSYHIASINFVFSLASTTQTAAFKKYLITAVFMEFAIIIALAAIMAITRFVEEFN